MSVQVALKLAAGEIGYRALKDPLQGSKYGRWMASQLNQRWLAGPSTRIWWCVIFTSWVVHNARGKLPRGQLYFNTDTLANAARSAGMLVDVRHTRPGDLVIFDWNRRTPATDHIGIVESVGGSIFTTIEGNTSPGNVGSQSAGNGVYRRRRSKSLVRYVVRPYYGGAAPASKPASQSAKPSTGTAPAFPLPSGCYYGPRSGPARSISGQTKNAMAPNDVVWNGSRWYSKGLHAWQKRMKERGWKINPDGWYGPETRRITRAFQAEKGLRVDYAIGPATWGAAWTAPVT